MKHLHLAFFVLLSVWWHADGRSIDEILRDAAPQGNDEPIHYGEDDVIVVEYDVMYMKDDYEQLMRQEQDHQGDRRKRKADSKARQWPNGVVPYVINVDDYNSGEIQMILDSMREVESHTCITFRPKTASDSNYIYIASGSGCTSYVGMAGAAGQLLSLGPGCRVMRITIHEFGHALGLHHEQHRPDRDGYITVHKENVDPQYAFTLNIFDNINTFSIPYDYSSVMHYGAYAFSDNGEPTIRTRDTTWQHRIGKAETISFADIKIINALYQCDAHCGHVSCRDDGFVDRNCVCQCRGYPTHRCDDGEEDGPGYKGMKCEDKNDNCAYWANIGECDKNPSYMMYNCGASCGVCDSTGERCDWTEDDADCPSWKARGCCSRYLDWMGEHCPHTCGFC